ITAVANIVLDGDVKATAFNLEDATDIALNVDESTGTDYAGVRFGNGSADNVLLRYLASSDTFETYVGGPNSITAGDGNESNIFRKIDVGAGTATYHSNYARIYEADVAASAVLDHTDNAYSNPFIMDDCNLWDDQAGDLRAKCGGSPASAIDGMTLTGLAHGDISVLGNAVATAIAAKDTYYQVTVFDTNSATEFLVDADHTNDHIQVDEAGTYLASLSASFNGNANNEYHLQLHKNNGATAFANVHISRKIGNGGDVGAAAVVGLVQLSANDTVELWVENKTGGNDMTIFESNISLVRVY
ncbi:MAG: hypothetical protein GY720_22260, partial [bacterium]|nr:hypothetical protein [bacterium]